MMSKIELKSVSKTYKGHSNENEVRALKNISFSISKENFVGITGESGSGKSTLLNIIGGVDFQTEGEVYVDNISLESLSENKLAAYRNQNVGYIFQKMFLDFDLTALENIEIPMIIKGIKKEERLEKATKLLKDLGMIDKKDVEVKYLSGGQMQRVCIARALANSPKIILADEPTGNLDSKNGEQIMQILKEIASNGFLVILVTHNLADLSYCERILYLKDGEITKDEIV